jgi:hypothetical protein
MLDSQTNRGRLNSRRTVSALGIAGALIFASACSASVAASPAGTSSPSESASASATATPTPTASSLARGVVAKGVANDGIGDYLQTSITDGDPAMTYDPAVVTDAAKAHFSVAELTEAQRMVVRFIAEEAIDSTLNGGTDVDGWFAAHKEQIYPAAQEMMLSDLKAGKTVLANETWMAAQPGLSYLHGADKSRVKTRNISLGKLDYAENAGLQAVWVDTAASYEMPVTWGEGRNKVQSTSAQLGFAAAKDPDDGKWKIAGWDTNYSTAEFIIK